jgi:sulfoxide reductase catalytic subunit YedY
MLKRLTENDVTPPALYWSRRRVLGQMASALSAPLAFTSAAYAAGDNCGNITLPKNEDVLTPLADVSGYNNYLEFSSDKKAVKVLAQQLTVSPWTVTVDGEVEKPFTLDASELTKLFGTEERIYRLRCVEGWSMVVPWMGFPLCRLLNRARLTSRAKFVEFIGLQRSAEMIGQRTAAMTALQWPYREALRIDEAMHPLTLATVGLYGEPLPKQNGAPLRLVVPWKYGYKSIKAITRVRLHAEPPSTSWAKLSPSEYGFYGNVNPDVAHPRWSQARENRIGELRKRPTLFLNGYADSVAQLYVGMDPKSLY